MRTIGFILILMNSILVGGAVLNRKKRLTDKQLVVMTVAAIIQVLSGFMAGFILMR